jgi:phage-related protein
VASRTLNVTIVGDSSSLSKAFGQAGKDAQTFGKQMSRSAKITGLALVGGLGVAAKIGFGELAEQQKVAAQTGAVLMSTGGAAKVSAKNIEGLAGALSAKSGVDDEAIQSGQNMLLTFTKIRNETGRGNKIFDEATKATLDLSVAMGKDMQSSAILVGKALNDPVKGMGALSKAGIQFTAEQKETIKTLVASGKTMDAQKLILGELETQFGGSAAAAGGTLTGSINKAKNSFAEMAANMTTTLLPAVTAMAGAFARASEFLSEHKTAAKVLVGVLGGLAGTLLAVSVATKLVTAAQGIAKLAAIGWTGAQWLLNAALTANPIGLVIVGLTALGAGLVLAWQKSETFRNIVTGAWDGVKETVSKVVGALSGFFTTFKGYFTTAKNWADEKIGEIVGFFTGLKARIEKTIVGLAAVFGAEGAVGKPFATMKTFVSDQIGGVVGFFTGLKDKITTAITGLGALFTAEGAVGKPFAAFKTFVSGMVGDVVTFFSKMPGRIAGAISDAVGGAWERIKDAFKSIFKGLPGFVKSILGIGSPSKVFEGIGEAIIAGTIKGIKNMAGDLLDAAWGVFGGLGSAENKGKEAVAAVGAGAAGIWRSLAAFANLQGWAVTSGLRGPRFPGDRSLHIAGRAVDIDAGGIAENLKAFHTILQRFGSANIKELFFDPAGFYVDNGTIARGAIGGHMDHVHWAMAKGGIFTKPWTGMVTVAERGPEGFFPLSSSLAGAALTPAGGTGAGVTVNVNVHGSVISDGELSRKVRDGLNEFLRANPRAFAPSLS